MQRSAELNRECHCISVDREKLRSALSDAGVGSALAALSAAPMFADSPVFLSQTELAAMTAAVAAVQRVVSLPSFVDGALDHAPRIAQVDHGPVGTLYGYDFHLTPQGPKLIEINTNAGGALLSVALAKAQAACCDEVRAAFCPHHGDVTSVPTSIVASFVREYQRQRGSDARPARVAIVDATPEQQFLYSEFQLFEALLREHGIEAEIVDVAHLRHADGALWHQDRRIDLVYNRVTDFYFEREDSHALRSAYTAGDVVVTPNPRSHALYANKRHLVTLGDADALARLGVGPADITLLTTNVPRAELLADNNRDRLWSERKRLFFKPLTGYGSKAAYRGDKLTHKTWQEIVHAQYVAQEIATPSERVVSVNGTLRPLKLDVRAYVDDQNVLLFASRLYQGQTTNFRTEGGGFASVFSPVAG